MEVEGRGNRKMQLFMMRMMAMTKVMMIIMENVNLKKIVMAKTMMTPGKMKTMTTEKMKMTQMAEMTTIALEVLGKMNSTKTQHATCNRLQEDLLG
jgi:hypothetical protein